MTLALFMEIVGWIGAVLILAGYGLLTAGSEPPSVDHASAVVKWYRPWAARSAT